MMLPKRAASTTTTEKEGRTLVKRFEAPQRVTIHPDRTFEVHPSAFGETQRFVRQEAASGGLEKNITSNSSSAAIEHVPAAPPNTVVESSSSFALDSSSASTLKAPEKAKFYRNGGTVCLPPGIAYAWSQTREDLTFLLSLHPNTLAKHVSVDLSEQKLKISITPSPPANVSQPANSNTAPKAFCLEKTFPYAVDTCEDNWLWELLSLPFSCRELLESNISSSAGAIAPASDEPGDTVPTSTSSGSSPSSGSTSHSSSRPSHSPAGPDFSNELSREAEDSRSGYATRNTRSAHRPLPAFESSQRFFSLTLKKRQIVNGVTVWWNRFFECDPEISVVHDTPDRRLKLLRKASDCATDQSRSHTPTKCIRQGEATAIETQTAEILEARKEAGNEPRTGNSTATASLQETWDEAHRQFRQKARESKLKPVSLGGL